MDTTLTNHELPEPDPPLSADDGLRSADGIRWLHWIGALVVGVSVIRLLAERWDQMSLALQFLVLVAGAALLQKAGDVARERLRLPAASAAFYFLFTALVPLLAWGAAHQGLVLHAFPFGLLSLGLGLGVLAVMCRRVLERLLGYHGWIYPSALTAMLIALPVLAFYGDNVVSDVTGFFLIAAIGLGVVMRLASRHVNRFFFHRDRFAGEDRPIHFLPFAVLALVYLGGMSLLSTEVGLLALPLAFLGIALIDTGEEYFQALVKVTGEVPERWPRRSVGLLAAGFALLAVAVLASPFDPAHLAPALVTAVASLRLFAWGLRYQRHSAYAFALMTALVAYHFSPALIPDAVRQLFWQLVEAIGIERGGPAVISLADIGSLAGLVALAAALRSRLTLSMVRVHAGFLTFQGLVVLATAAPEPAAARLLMPVAAGLLMLATAILRRVELFPITYLAAAGSVFFWADLMAGALFPKAAYVALGVFNLAVLAAAFTGWSRLRRFLESDQDGPDEATLRNWVVVMPLITATASVLMAFGWLDLAVSGVVILLAAGAFFASGLILREVLVVTLSTVMAWVGAHVLAFELGGETLNALTVMSQVWLVVFAALAWRARPELEFLHWARQAWSFAAILGAASGLFIFIGAAFQGQAVWASTHLALLGVVASAFGLRLTLAKESEGLPILGLGLGFSALYLPTQLATAEWIDHPAVFLLIAGLALTALRAVCHWKVPVIGRLYGVEAEKIREVLRPQFRLAEAIWIGLVITIAVLFAGTESFYLALTVMAVQVHRIVRHSEKPWAGWWLQAWVGLSFFEAAAAGWIGLGQEITALALVLVAVGERILAEVFERRERRWLATACYPLAFVFATAGAWLSIIHTFDTASSPWWPVLPAFLASLFFGYLAREEYQRVFSALSSAAYFALALIALLGHLAFLGAELYWLAPGMALIGLSRMLERELGQKLSLWLFTVGATCLYAMPVVGLLGELSWAWQVVMLLLSVAFGAASFRLKSRSLLTLSTAAAVIDLAVFLLKLGQTSSVLLWAVGIVFGLSLMGFATLLEYRRELILQRVRVWGHEIRSWT